MAKIVIVDDEPFILMMIEDKLKRAGFEVVTVNNSQSALESIRTERPDLVILDWMMPDMSGLDICRALKSDGGLSGIPVVMLTAKGQEDDEKLGLSFGVERYITKPFSPKALLENVIEILASRGK
ncbi:MAG: response regulator [Nitrospiraceae bacterium]|nr:response regulator [Nitrospiraceae bacterium]